MRKRTVESIDSPRAIGFAIFVAVLMVAWIAWNVWHLWKIEDKQQALFDNTIAVDKAISSQELSGADLDAAYFCLDNHMRVVRTEQGIQCASE